MASLDKKYFQRLMESSPDIIIAVDKSGTVNYYNDGARTSLGYSSEEMIGEGCTRIYPSIDEARRVMKAMRASVDKGQIASFETEFRNKGGEIIPVMITGALIHDDDGKEIGSIGFARDIRRMRHAQQLATAGEIAVSLAHEINNPLESITNNLELLSQSLETHLTDAEKVVENERLDSIRNSLERVQAIVRRLDEMTRKGEYETRDYLAGKRMADLAPRADAKVHTRPHDAPHLTEQSPLAGMSVLVLDDDTAVVNSLADLLRRAPDPGDRLLLRRYERARAEDILALRWVTDGLFRLFAANHRVAARIRNIGLNLTNSSPVIKTLLARRAMEMGAGLHHKEPR